MPVRMDLARCRAASLTVARYAPAVLALAAWASVARADEISVTQYGVSMYGAPYAIALEKGFLKDAGITEINGSGGGGTTVRNILASAIPYGEVATAAALAAADQGLDLVIVNVGTRTVAEFSVVTMPGSDVTAVGDLAGKKVAITSPKGSSDMVLQLMEQQAGIKGVQRIASGGYVNGLTLLEQGAVSAAMLIEPLSLIRVDKYRTIAAARDLLPAMTTSVGITTRAWAKANPDRLRAIIAGRRAAVEALYADPAGAAAIVETVYRLDPAIARKAVDTMLGPRMWSLGDFSQPELDRVAEALRLIGQVKGQVDWSTLIDKSYLPADLRAKS